MKNIRLAILATGAAALMAGCASTSQSGEGAMGNGNETAGSNGSGAGTPDTTVYHVPAAATGANGSISRGNPFGVGVGSGLTSAK